ncbi:MAG: hypothetical protein C4560_02965 [Nitrospiraceae bacterium]|nr:MAG: hypothetical protein C4560_02965 [Nitrospiraceae bacterium]
MSLGFGLEGLNNLFSGDGIAPVFSASEMSILKHRADEAKVVYIPNKAMNKAPYAVKAYNMALSYKRREIIWENMNKNQREFIIRIKDGLK